MNYLKYFLVGSILFALMYTFCALLLLANIALVIKYNFPQSIFFFTVSIASILFGLGVAEIAKANEKI